MKKRFSFKIIVIRIIISLIALPVWANSEIPGNTMDNIETPPDVTPIDNYVFLAMFICIVFVGYFFHKSNKSLSQEKL
jgi:hypothetical protein